MSSSTDNLSLSSTRSSTRSSNMHIAMPAPPTTFSANTSYNPHTAYIIAPMPAPAQNPYSAAWSPSHDSHHPHHHHHIATPHPLAATTSFLDKHVPLFAKHHGEFSAGHDARAAKREARRSRIDTAIPEVDVENLPHPPSSDATIGIEAAIHAVTATATAPALADSRAADNAAWRDVLAKREAARRRSGSDEAKARSSNGHFIEEGSDSESHRGYKGSPAVTP